jgi:hypothetical protein
MSEIAEEINDHLVFVVTGANWSAKVVVDGINLTTTENKDKEKIPLFDEETMMIEAATRAIEIFYGIKIQHKNGQVEPINPHSIDIISFPDTEEINIGPLLKVNKLNSKEEDFKLIPTHVILADGGFYKQSVAMFEIWVQQLQEMEKLAKEVEKKLEADIVALKEKENPVKSKRKYTKRKKK